MLYGVEIFYCSESSYCKNKPLIYCKCRLKDCQLKFAFKIASFDLGPKRLLSHKMSQGISN